MIQTRESISGDIEKFAEEILQTSGKEYLSYRVNLSYAAILTRYNEISALFESSFYFRNLSDDLQVLALGKLLRLNEETVSDREKIEGKISKLEEAIEANYDIGGAEIPLFFGGMKFTRNGTSGQWSDFPENEWFLPRFLLIGRQNSFSLIINFARTDNFEKVGCEAAKLMDIAGEPGCVDDPKINFEFLKNESTNDESWMKNVDIALRRIDRGELEKVVLSRQLVFRLEDNPGIDCLLCKLEEVFPYCYIFSYKENDSLFFGASPEKLFEIRNGKLKTDSLAGSISRGMTLEEDGEQKKKLLASLKDISEHKMVLHYILNILGDYAESISYPDKAEIRTLSNIHHLLTPIEAELKPGVSLFSIIHNLHPTPAVCGLPTDRAKEIISELEDFPRGMFSGVLGWFNFRGDCQFAVGIRSALLKDNKLFTFSGCGIVSGSDSENELLESDLKLNSIISLFQDENRCKPQ